MMSTTTPTTPLGSGASAATRLADQAAQGADDTIRATQRVTNEALDRLSDKVHDAHDKAAPKIVRMAEQAETLVRRGSDALREGSHQVREKAVVASDRTIAYIRDEPVKAVLIAAAAGAAMLALVNLLTRSRH
jgi:ElaB/YqjD/DUF883 family membrane-anchored ribosome-binding protein